MVAVHCAPRSRTVRCCGGGVDRTPHSRSAAEQSRSEQQSSSVRARLPQCSVASLSPLSLLASCSSQPPAARTHSRLCSRSSAAVDARAGAEQSRAELARTALTLHSTLTLRTDLFRAARSRVALRLALRRTAVVAAAHPYLSTEPQPKPCPASSQAVARKWEGQRARPPLRAQDARNPHRPPAPAPPPQHPLPRSLPRISHR